jgi:GNAT superfamily N-acetyltransferase
MAEKPGENIDIELMTEKFILWRCLHFGPLSSRTIDRWPPDTEINWKRCHERNIPLLVKLTRAYGACAILARAGERIVGSLRFYPRSIWDMRSAGEMCLQQDFPYGPADDFVDRKFPPLEEIEDRTLAVHCLMTGSSLQNENPFQRKGIGTRMVRFLIQWAKTNGWEGIEADAFEDIPIIYEITGSAGINFWKKLGFRMVDRHPHPHLEGHSEFVSKMEEQARSVGISPERAKDRLVMRLDIA